jgi:hypothetical protein
MSEEQIRQKVEAIVEQWMSWPRPMQLGFACFVAGLEAAKACVVPDGNPVVALMAIAELEAEARKAAAK